MKILAVDTSSKAASAAITEDDTLIGEFFVNARLTHSGTIMPMVNQLLSCTKVNLRDIGVFAVTTGPGSFTGLRIGLSAVKGMAFALDKPCAALSTLHTLAMNLTYADGLICPVMDARCNQVYTALFQTTPHGVVRVTPDQAMTLDELETVCQAAKKTIFLVGDGAVMCYNRLSDCDCDGISVRLAPASLMHQRASCAAFLAAELAATGQLVQAGQLIPDYLRLPQAMRNLQQKS